MFLVGIQLSNLKVGSALLLMFFCYDVFMVFISPSIFGGTSVMVSVATGGGANIAKADPGDDGMVRET